MYHRFGIFDDCAVYIDEENPKTIDAILNDNAEA